MPKQVLAEEIERFLGTVDGVASARLLTSSAGEIEQIYVTADGGTDARAARRAVVAALVTRFGIPVEPWRVQVAALKQFAPAELPHLRVLRIEETTSAAEVTARVQVAWERAGEQRTGFGEARGPVGAHHRLRTLAAATIDAARTVVEPSHRRITIQHVSMTTCMDRPLVLVGIAVGGPGGQEAFVGAALQRHELSDAAVAAALDAVTKSVLRVLFETPRGAPEDRRAHLEAMRRYARGARRAGPEAAAAPNRPPEGPASGAPEPPVQRGPAPPAGPGDRIHSPGQPSGEQRAPSSSRPPAPDAVPVTPQERSASAPLGGGEERPRTFTPPIDGGHHSGWPARPWAAGPRAAFTPGGVGTVAHPDVLIDPREIRPEEKGGAALAAHHDNSRTGVAPRTGRQAIEDEYFAPLIERRTPVHVRCRDGYELSHAVVREVGTYTLVVETEGTTELLYKHAIISVRPAGARG